MEVSEHVLDLVNNRTETRGFLATCDREGRCDVACFSSFRLADRATATVTFSSNRSLANLKANPSAAFVVTSGESIQDVDGCRVYLLVQEIVEDDPALKKARRTTAEQMGEEAAKHVKAVVNFDITEARPIIDYGQGV